MKDFAHMTHETNTAAAKDEAKPALVPKLRFPEFRGAESWKERSLGDFLSESRLPGSKGNVAKKITVKLWGNGVFEKNDAIQGSINTQYFRRKSGQFIYSKLDFLNQAFGIIPPSLDNFESTVDLPCFDFADGLNSVFLLEYVKRRDFYERLGETADGSRKARRIHAETFLSFPIALPKPAEHQKIAECLSSLDELMVAQARKVDALKTHKNGLMQQLFPAEGETQPRLRFRDIHSAADWVAKSVGAIAPLQRGFDLPSDEIRPGTVPIVYSNGPKGFHERGMAKGPGIVTGRSGTIGKIHFIESGDYWPHNTSLWVTSFEGNVPKFVYYLYEAIGFLRFASGSGVPTLNRNDAHSFAASVPPHTYEQQRIASSLSSLDDLITAETQKLDALKTHKKGLMQQLFPSPEAVEV